MKNLLFLILFPIISNGQNLNITNQSITLTSGSYQVIEFGNNSELTIDGDVSINTWNFNGKPVKVTITNKGKLTHNGTLNMNGKVTFINYGIGNFKGAFELQNGENILENYKTLSFQEGQINDNTSKIKNCGLLTISNSLNINNGTVELCCGQIITGTLNYGQDNPFYGEGSIKATNINFNKILTQSDKIYLCYSGHINDTSKIGKAKRDCEKICDSLPITFSLFSATQNENYIDVNFVISSHDNVKELQIKAGTDYKNLLLYKVIKIDDSFKINKLYTVKIPIK